jgi:hypothetical protein
MRRRRNNRFVSKNRHVVSSIVGRISAEVERLERLPLLPTASEQRCSGQQKAAMKGRYCGDGRRLAARLLKTVAAARAQLPG